MGDCMLEMRSSILMCFSEVNMRFLRAWRQLRYRWAVCAEKPITSIRNFTEEVRRCNACCLGYGAELQLQAIVNDIVAAGENESAGTSTAAFWVQSTAKRLSKELRVTSLWEDTNTPNRAKAMG